MVQKFLQMLEDQVKMTNKFKNNLPSLFELNICIIGMGYVGLPLALVIAENGGEVIGVDVDVEKINNLKKGNCFLEEDELISLWNSQRNKIKFTNEIENADLFLISVSDVAIYPRL